MIQLIVLMITVSIFGVFMIDQTSCEVFIRSFSRSNNPSYNYCIIHFTYYTGNDKKQHGVRFFQDFVINCTGSFWNNPSDLFANFVRNFCSRSSGIFSRGVITSLSESTRYTDRNMSIFQ